MKVSYAMNQPFHLRPTRMEGGGGGGGQRKQDVCYNICYKGTVTPGPGTTEARYNGGYCIL